MWPTHYIPNQSKIEGVPPPSFYLTTPPYPIELVEGIQVLAEPDWLGFNPFAEDEAYIATVAVPLSGILTRLLTDFDGGIEEIQCVARPVSGTLLELLVTMDASNEKLQTVGIPLSGILRDPLVVYDNWPLNETDEDLQATGRPVSGALT